jgi:transcriptional regulator with XRE-family HTH domain
MADELGVTQSYISMIERGERRLTPNLAEKLNKIVSERLTNK